jgi:hypothetical protein
MVLQEFGHPQARFMHEKGKRCGLPSWLQRSANRSSYKAIDGSMFTVTVRNYDAMLYALLTQYCYDSTCVPYACRVFYHPSATVVVQADTGSGIGVQD